MIEIRDLAQSRLLLAIVARKDAKQLLDRAREEIGEIASFAISDEPELTSVAMRRRP